MNRELALSGVWTLPLPMGPKAKAMQSPEQDME